MNVLTLIAGPNGPGIDDTTIAAARDALAACGGDPAAKPDWLAPRHACDLAFAGTAPAFAQEAVGARLGGAKVDIVAQPCAGRRKKLLVADMESTIITNEFIDELADLAGVGAKVAAITDRVVRGEIEFAAALEERVAMLAGLSVADLERAYAHLEIIGGARSLAPTMRAHGARTALVSGGFTCFSVRVREAVGFDSDHANTLEITNGRLTGRGTLSYKVKICWCFTLRVSTVVNYTFAKGSGAEQRAMSAGARQRRRRAELETPDDA